MYGLRIQIYATKVDKTIYFGDFKEALKVAKFNSALHPEWTRHSSCGRVIQHLDTYWDMYNEGCVSVELRLL